MGQVEAALTKFSVGGVAGSPELLVRAQVLYVCQGDDGIHVLGQLVSRLVRGESQGEGSASVERQLDWMIEVPVKDLQDQEGIVHGA